MNNLEIVNNENFSDESNKINNKSNSIKNTKDSEGIPILEALIERIPIIVRDIKVFEEYKEYEVVYKAKTIDEFKDKINKILNNELPSLQENGYNLAIKKDVKIIGKQLIEVYNKLLK